MSIDFFQNGLCFHCHMVINELHEFKDFHYNTETLWQKKDGELQEKLEKILSQYPKEHHKDIVESYSWELHLNQIKFPDIHRESIILTIYSFLESQLNRLCEIFAESVDSKILQKDLKGQGIERAFLYLKKVACLEFSNMGKELPYIKNVNALRNHIVHSGSILPKDPNANLNRFVVNDPSLYGKAGEPISIRPEFICEFIEILIGFFEKLGKEVERYIKEYNS